jgi:molecular chaperone GrpE
MKTKKTKDQHSHSIAGLGTAEAEHIEAPTSTPNATRAVESYGTAADEAPGVLSPVEPTAGQPADAAVELQARVGVLEGNLLRARADFQNLQRRTAVERSEAIRYANADLMKSLVGVLDDFERSLAAAENPDNFKSVVEGVRLVYGNLVKALTDQGLEPIEALDRPFDPTIHEALLQVASTDRPAGTVTEQVARGYRLRDRVLRPAKVIVSRAPDPIVDPRSNEAAEDSPSSA